MFTIGGVWAQGQTALDRYMAKPDDNYSWKLVNTIDGSGWRAYQLELISQKWLTEKEVDKPVWKHWLTVIRPSKVIGTTGFLFIGGGNTKNPKPPAAPDVGLILAATTTKSVVSELRMVPSQPVIFADKPGKEMVEDEMIAYTWDKYLRTGDEKWPLRLPMTKAAVRAMDAITEFGASDVGGRVTVEKFVVAGGSKRGWTTWTTAAVDKRVVAIVPMVIDMLNVEKSFEHHYKTYGFYAPAVRDYEVAGIMDWQGRVEYQNLMKIEEPFEYRDRLTIPKYIINATGDQFFLPDSWQFYMDSLQGEKHLRYVPNADHSMRNSDALQGLIAYYDYVLRDKPRPKFLWNVAKDGTITVDTTDAPVEVKYWEATNPNARDFRMEKIGPAYKATVLTPSGRGHYEAKVKAPEKGFSIGFIELTYPGPDKMTLKFTSGTKVMPDVEPFENYKPKPIAQ